MLKVANPREKGNKVDNREFDEGINYPTLSMQMNMIFPGMDREREMAAMVSALTHVVSGEVPTGDYAAPSAIGGGDVAAVTRMNMPCGNSTTPSLASSSNYVGSSGLKRNWDQYDTSFVDHFSHGGASSPAIQTSKHDIEILPPPI